MKLFKRENYLRKIRGFYDADDIIKVITGVRRCGKTSLMEMIADNYPKYVLTTDYLLQKRNGILHENIIDYMREGKVF